MAEAPVTRAGGQRARSGGQGAGGKQFLGLPAWMWAVGGVAVVAGYLYIKSKSSQQQPSGQGGGGRGQGGGGAPTGWSSASFMSWVQDHQGTPPVTPPPPHPKPKKDPDPGKGKGDGHGK